MATRDMERIRVELDKTATDHTPRSLRFERALEAALLVLQRAFDQGGKGLAIDAVGAISRIADILEGKDANR